MQSYEQILVFQIGRHSFGLEIDHIESIMDKGEVTPVPLAPFMAEGIIFYREGILPVVNLMSLLEIEGDSGKCFLIVVRGLTEDFAVSLDKICCIMSSDKLALTYYDEEGRTNPFFAGTGSYKGAPFTLLDFTRVDTLTEALKVIPETQ